MSSFTDRKPVTFQESQCMNLEFQRVTLQIIYFGTLARYYFSFNQQQ